MSTVYTPAGREEWPDNDLRLQAYRALKTAAERMGKNGWEAERLRLKWTRYEACQGIRAYDKVAHKYYRRSIYTPTEQHCEIVEAMPKVLSGEITPDEAMNLLFRGDILNIRTGGYQ